jgi:hypothetical protein
MRVQILAEAEQDLLDGMQFYENQRPGLGSYFRESLLADIRSLRRFAGNHGREHGYLTMYAKRFPYAIFYRVEVNTVLVHAVLDCRRDPLWIQRQLEQRKPCDES